VVKYPRFFTPNQDGFNDTWNIFDLKFDRNAKVTIFDRFGKILTTLSTSGKGWAGVYNSKNMPSNDYWFLVDYVYEGQKRQFKSHFTLKR
jgi:gliding motility-associated-like protein